MTYELIDQTGEQFGRNRQWLIVISDGHRKRGFCTIPLWEDFPAGQLKADAEQVLNALNERDELRRKLFCAEDENARLCAQVAELVKAGERILGYGDIYSRNQYEESPYEQLKAAIAAAEGGAE